MHAKMNRDLKRCTYVQDRIEDSLGLSHGTTKTHAYLLFVALFILVGTLERGGSAAGKMTWKLS